jgi:diguanylate cyclase
MPEQDPENITVEQLQERIQKLEEDNRRWMRLAGINSRTNLPNNLMLYQIFLPAELRKYDKRGVTLACLLIAPDGLGDINQDHGRAVGDQLIKEIADFLKEKIGTDEKLFHTDGANFALLMMGASEGRAKRKAIEIKSDLTEETISVGARKFSKLTCSIGIVAIDEQMREETIPQKMDHIFGETLLP